MRDAGSVADRPGLAGPFPTEYQTIVMARVRADFAGREQEAFSVHDVSITEPQLKKVWVGLLNGGDVYAWAGCARYSFFSGGRDFQKVYIYLIKFGGVFRTIEGRGILQDQMDCN